MVKAPLTLRLNQELTQYIHEALRTEDERNRFATQDIRWHQAHNHLRALREEVGTLVIWQYQEQH